jgi:hypothetical protein
MHGNSRADDLGRGDDERMTAECAVEATTVSTLALSADERAAYYAKGFIVVRGRFTHDEVRAWQVECDRLWTRSEVQLRNRRWETRGHVSGQPVLDRMDPVLDLSPLLREVVDDERIGAALRTLWAESARVFRCKLVMKRPGTFGYLMHQDFPYWEWMGIPPDDLLTVCIAIDAADSDNGAIEVFPRLHHRRLPGLASEPRDIDEAQMDTSAGEILALAPGDLLILHSGTPHRSGVNRTDRMRRALLPSYACARYGDRYDAYDRRRRELVRIARSAEPDTFFR